MSKRGQEGTSGEGSEMAKPGPMKLMMAKPRPMNLMSHSLLSRRKNSPQDLSDSNNPGNAKAEQGGVSTSVWKHMRDTNHHPAVLSQARQQEGTQHADTWKQEKRSGSSDSTSVCIHMPGVETHMIRSKMEFRNVQISDHQQLRKVFQNLQKRLGTTENSSTFGIEAMKTNVLCHRQ